MPGAAKDDAADFSDGTLDDIGADVGRVLIALGGIIQQAAGPDLGVLRRHHPGLGAGLLVGQIDELTDIVRTHGVGVLLREWLIL